MRKPITAVTAAALTAVALAACGSSSSPSGGSTSASASASSNQPTATAAKAASTTSGVTLEVGDQAGTGAQTLLQASGLLKKLPFTVKFADFTSGPPMLQALSAGHLDIGGVGDAPPVFATASGSGSLAIVGALANGANNAALVVPKNSSITSIKQLKGKKIAVAQGSSADYHLLTVLKKAGLKPTDVTLDYLQPADALAALQAHQVDAWDVWSPFIEQSVAQGDRILVNGKGYGAPYSYEVASKSALQDPKKVAAIKTYLKLLNQAHIWANTHPTQWAAVWAKATGLPNAVMVQAAKDDEQKPTAVNSTIVASEQGLVNSFYSAGLIPKSYSFSPFVTNAFNGSL